MKKKAKKKEGKEEEEEEQQHKMEKWGKLCLCQRALQVGRWSNRLLDAGVTITRA